MCWSNLGEGAKALIGDSGVRVLTMKGIDRSGIARVMEDPIATAASGTGSIHVSFDLDVGHPAMTPGVATPVKGGHNYGGAHMLTETGASCGPRSR